MTDNLKKALRTIVTNSHFIKLLKDDPDALAAELGLSGEDAKALRSAELLIKAVPDAKSRAITTHPITITITHHLQ
jgi:hypothetical protein